ncbi:hypothetical protein PV08_01798 [Exophiala spinifera]|uniref:AB hydrolase-1 domain-containing protein n=1 Tax=Exophiala spinifera TaxID=91928 RepID=A0A0D2BQG7_9EURO|nr:uncharacterized protein PV08_01798 [Exophiala spinifera]KIW21218.1 hypothetical protein PV08_01798 [Exophiala spinifera]
MDLLDKKSLKTTRGLSYAYYVLKDHPTSSALPTILFLRGFPDSSSLWFGIIERIAHLQYPIMAIEY